MSIPSLRWRHLLEALAGLAIGLVCLVAFSGTASAGQIDTPAPAATGPVTGLLDGLQQTLDPVLAPVTQGVVQPTITTVGATLDGVVPGLGTTVQQTVDGLGTTVDHTVDGVGTTVDGVVLPLLPPPTVTLPDVPGIVDELTPPAVDSLGTTIPDALAADPAAAATDDAVTVGAQLRSSTSPVSSDGRTTAAVAQLSAAPITGDSPLSVPGPQSLPLAIISTVSSALATGANGAGGLLLAILVGVAALALRPAQGGMYALRQTSPNAPSFAISVPPG